MSYRIKRKIIIVLSVLFLLILSLTLLFIVRVWAAAGDPVTEIGTAEELKALAEDPSRWGGNFKLTADINLSTVCGADVNGGTNWTPIGNNSIRFTGIFDGDDHTVSGLYIETTNSYQGLFGYVLNGTIKNLKVEGAVTGHGYVGGIVGYFDSTTNEKGIIENCSFVGTVEGGGTGSSDLAVGGIAGYNHNGTVKECRSSGTVHCRSMYAGGIVGQNEGKSATVIDCENSGAVSVIDSNLSSTAGGIAGTNTGSIMNCRNKGSIGTGNNLVVGGIVGTNSSASVTQCCNTGTVTGGNYIGGIVGSNSDASVTQCCNTGTVTGSSTIGGIAGLNTTGASIEQCYNLNTVSGTSYIGGVAGQSDGKATVTNCYNKAAVSGTSNVGGLVGRNYGGLSKSPTLGTVTNCYNRGTVEGNASNSGGVVGLNKINTSEGTVKNCYYLAGTAKGGIAGSDAVGKAEAKTVAKFNSGEVAWLLQKGNTVNGVWGQELVNSAARDDYPLLIHFPEGADGKPDDVRTDKVPLVARISFYVPNDAYTDYMQLKNNGSNEFYVQYSNAGGQKGTGIGAVTMPTNDSHTAVPALDKDDEPIVWLVNDPNGNNEFASVKSADILWNSEKHNETWLYVKWKFGSDALFGLLTIKAADGEKNESFIYYVKGTADDDTEIDLTVTVKGGGSTTILVPVGKYTVTEQPALSWRYGNGIPTGDDWVINGKTATTTIEEDSDSTYGGQEKTVIYSHERNKKNWLGGENFKTMILNKMTNEE